MESKTTEKNAKPSRETTTPMSNVPTTVKTTKTPFSTTPTTGKTTATPLSNVPTTGKTTTTSNPIVPTTGKTTTATAAPLSTRPTTGKTTTIPLSTIRTTEIITTAYLPSASTNRKRRTALPVTITESKPICMFACKKIADNVQNYITALRNIITLQTNVVMQYVELIEKELRNLSTCTGEIASNIVAPSFHLAAALDNSTAAFTVRSTSVWVNSKPDHKVKAVTVYAAELALPKKAMSVFLTTHQSSQQSGNLRQVTSFFPGTPFISVAGLATNNTSPISGVNYTFRINASELHSTATALLSSASSGRTVLTSLQPSCRFLNINESIYSPRGCSHVPSAAKPNLSCQCDHATLFTVLLTATTITVPRGVEVNYDVI